MTALSFEDDIRHSLFNWQQSGLATALVTLINYEGSSPRPVGSQLIVNENGEYRGLISGGCLETALIHEAQACIKSGAVRVIRYGRDSDYIDIQLPCGSGIDVLIQPNPETSMVEALSAAATDRQEFLWEVDLKTGEMFIKAEGYAKESHLKTEIQATFNQQLSRQQLESSMTSFSKRYTPLTQVNVLGNGAIFDYFKAMAALFDIELVAHNSAHTNLKDTHFERLDEWSAFVTLSHEHHWEEEALMQVIQSEAFYISALGSKATHQRRTAGLKQLGASEADIARIKGPAGLDLGGQTPPEIAISILAEIVSYKNKRHFVLK